MYPVMVMGGVNLYTYDNLYQYKLENNVLVKRSEEELEEERKERLENPDYSKIAQEVKDKLEHFLYNPTLSETKNPDNLGTGIYQYWGTYFDTSPFQVPHILIDFNAQSLRFQIGANHKGNVVFRSRGATETEWTSWKNIEDSTNFPFLYGSGILIPGSDVRFKYMLYTNMGMMDTEFDMNLKSFIARIFIPNGTINDSNDVFPLKVTWETILKNDTISNPNLLLNSNFKICQRDMAEYVTNKAENDGRYYPDRWICARDYNDSGLKYMIKEDGLHACFLNNAGSWGKLQYKFDKDLSHFLSEKIITISGKVKFSSDQVQLKSLELYDGNGIVYSCSTFKKEENGIKVTVKLPKLTGLLIFDTKFLGVTDTEIIFEYLKIELGNEATLYIPPDPAQELLKSKYYYQRIHELRNKGEGTFSKISYSFNFTDYYIYHAGDTRNYINSREAYYPQMRIIPTAKLVGNANSDQGYYIGYKNGGGIDNKEWIYRLTVDMQHIGIGITEKNGNITEEDFNKKCLYFTHNCYIELDAEVH